MNEKLGLRYIWIYPWILDNSNHQHDVHYIAKLQKYGGWQAWNTDIRRCGCCSCCGYCVCSCCLMFLSPHVHLPYSFGQVVCSEIPKCQFQENFKLINVKNILSFCSFCRASSDFLCTVPRTPAMLVIRG